MIFTAGQYEKLSDLFLDIAKAMYITAFASPVAANRLILGFTAWSLLVGLFFTYLSLIAIKRKEERL